MKKKSLTAADRKLVAAAVKAVKKPVLQLNGETSPALVGAALRLKGGKIVTSVNLMTDVGSLATCAEPIALAQAAQMPDHPVEAIVAVYNAPGQEPVVIPPCGRCREAITDYALECDVILREPKTAKLFKVNAGDLLPFRYAQFWRAGRLV